MNGKGLERRRALSGGLAAAVMMAHRTAAMAAPDLDADACHGPFRAAFLAWLCAASGRFALSALASAVSPSCTELRVRGVHPAISIVLMDEWDIGVGVEWDDVFWDMLLSLDLDAQSAPDGARWVNHDLDREFQVVLRDPAIQPNAAHFALARLARGHPGPVLVVTQNVDDLHERAGHPSLLHMHGELAKARCVRCGEVSPFEGAGLAGRTWFDAAEIATHGPAPGFACLFNGTPISTSLFAGSACHPRFFTRGDEVGFLFRAREMCAVRRLRGDTMGRVVRRLRARACFLAIDPAVPGPGVHLMGRLGW